MKTYKYQVIDSSGKTISGTHQSISEDATRQYLLDQGNVVLSVKVKKFSFWKRWRHLLLWIPFRKDSVVAYLLELLNLTKSGISIGGALKLMVESSSRYRFRLFSGIILARLQEGEGFWEIMADYQFLMRKVVPSRLIAQSKSSNIVSVLEVVCNQYLRSRKFHRAIFIERIPQLVTFLVSFSVIVYYLDDYIGSILKVYRAYLMEVNFPFYIMATYHFCHFFVTYWPIIVFVVIFSGFFLAIFTRLPYCDYFTDWLSLVIFPFSRLVDYHQKHLFFRFFILLMEWGFSVQSAFPLCASFMSNKCMIRRVERIIKNFSRGVALKEAVCLGRFFNKQEVYIFSSQAKSQVVDAMRNYLDTLESNLNLFVIVISQSIRFFLYLIIIVIWGYAVFIHYRVIVLL